MESKENQEEEYTQNTVEPSLDTWITHDTFTWHILPSFSAGMYSLRQQKQSMHTHKHTLNQLRVPRLM